MSAATPPQPTPLPPPQPTPLPPLRRIVRGAGPGLVLAHGAGGSIEANFGPILDRLADHHTVVAPDYPGSGQTPRAHEPLTLDGLADALVAAAVAEGLESFAVAGYSLGTAVAVRAATRHPQRITGLALTAPFAHANPRFLLLTKLWRELLQSGDRHRLAEFLSLMAVGAPAMDPWSAKELDIAVTAGATGVPPGTADHLDLLESVDVRRDLGNILVPTLVISTIHDILVTPFHHRQVASGIRGARLVTLASGHLPAAEAPAQWTAALCRLLDDLSS